MLVKRETIPSFSGQMAPLLVLTPFDNGSSSRPITIETSPIAQTAKSHSIDQCWCIVCTQIPIPK